MALTVSFPVGVLGSVTQVDFYANVFKGLVEIVAEEDVQGVQIYPAKWPRKVLITVKDRETKEALLISGIDILGHHIELKDENEEFTKVTIKDLMVDFPDDKLTEILSEYGKVIDVDKEMIYVDGRKTSWTTGTRFVSMCPIYYTIPQRLSTEYGSKQISMSVWYRRPIQENVNCKKCGGTHLDNNCEFDKRVCFICKGDHKRHECQLYDGSRVSDEVFCFMGKKSLLSNFNTDFPVTIDGINYSCNEKYIQQQKALLFGDERKAKLIMEATEPKEIKELGKRIKGYNDSAWKAQAPSVIMTCNRQKVYDYPEVREYLTKTGNRKLGEATPDPFFGIGIHIGDVAVFNPAEWPGRNIMGTVLTELRSEIFLMQSAFDDIPDSSVKQTSASENTENKTEVADENDAEPTNENEKFYDAEPINENDAEPTHEAPSGKSSSVVQQPEPSYAALKPVEPMTKYTLMLGDSNLKGVSIDTEGLDIKIKKICRPEASVNDVDDLLKESELKPESVNCVLLHVGTFSWSSNVYDEVGDGDNVYRDYIEAMNSCASRFPDANFVISSVLPRKPLKGDAESHQTKINTEAKKLNGSLKRLTKTDSNVLFIDNDEIVYDANNELYTYLYNEIDYTGVHLNDKGLAVLSDNLTKGLRNMLNIY